METAAELVRVARRYRQLTQKELAGISGVSAATISRVESGQVDPAYGTVVRLLRTMGFRPGPDLYEEADDGRILEAILSEPKLAERFDTYRVAAQVTPVAARPGARVIVGDLDEMIELLEGAGITYGVSVLEGFYGGWSERGPQSLWPVVYIDQMFEPPWPVQPVPGRRGAAYILPMTENAARFVERVNDLMVMSPDWAIIDTIASPGRQSDVGLELLAALGEQDRRSVA